MIFFVFMFLIAKSITPVFMIMFINFFFFNEI